MITNNTNDANDANDANIMKSEILDQAERACLLAHMSKVKTETTNSGESGRFNEPMKISFGTAKDALNFSDFLGMSDEYVSSVVSNGEEVMKREIELLHKEGKRSGDPDWWFTDPDEIMEHWNYVVHEKCSEKEYPNGTRDKGRPTTMDLNGFMKIKEVKAAGLKREQVIAIRVYTSVVYKYINEPLRNQKLYRTYKDQPNKPRHPLAAMVCHLFIGLKQMRRIANLKPGEIIVLWRGLKNVDGFSELLKRGGGTEQAPMSTSRNMNVALDYGTYDQGRSMTRSALLKIDVRNDLEMGADIQCLSMFPDEAETLFPPLAFLKPSRNERVGDAKCKIDVIEMTLNLSSDLGFGALQVDVGGFVVGEKIRVVLDGESVLRSGEIMTVSSSDGVTVQYDNGSKTYIPNHLKQLVDKGKQVLEKQRMEKALEEHAVMAARKVKELRLENARAARLLAESQSNETKSASVGETKGSVDVDGLTQTSVNEWMMNDPELKIRTDVSATLLTLHLNHVSDFENITDEGFETLGNAMNKPESRRWKNIGRKKVNDIVTRIRKRKSDILARKEQEKKKEAEDLMNARKKKEEQLMQDKKNLLSDASKCEYVAEWIEVVGLPSAAREWMTKEGYLDGSMEDLRLIEDDDVNDLLSSIARNHAEDVNVVENIR